MQLAKGVSRSLFLLLVSFGWCWAASAQVDSITTTGRTQTTLLRDGNVVDVTTNSVHGVNALNEFGRFNVASGETVNLFVPDQAQNLLNLIRDEASTIDGQVNSWFQGQLGGNVFFLNPHGIVIGQDGSVNVGSLTLVTPTQAFMDEFFDGTLAPNNESIIQVLEGQVPIDANGLITVHGHVLATQSVDIDAGAVVVNGNVRAGGADVSLAMNAANLINLDGMDAATGLSVTESGSIRILAAGDFVNTGEIGADGADGIDAGSIDIHAGGDLTLESGSTVSARGGSVDSNGGVIDLFADDNAYLNTGATIDARGGTVSGDGGAIEFSAEQRVVLDGGNFRVDAADGEAGSVLIDPEEIEVVSSDLNLNGGNFSLEASESVTVNPGVVISTRAVADPDSADQATALSTGDSGNLSLTAPNITVADGAALYAHSVNDLGTTFSGGDVTLTATRDDSGSTSITLTNADVRGDNVTLEASVATSNDVLDLVVLNATANADITVSGSTILADNQFSAASAASIDAQTGLLPLPFSSIDANARATVDVNGASTVTAANGNVVLSASSDVTTDATPSSFLDDLAGDAGVGRSDVSSQATVHVGDDAQVNSGGSVSLTATNAVDATAVADASAAGAAAAGASVAVSVVDATTMATVDGDASINATGNLTVSADSSIDSQALASAATNGASEDMEGDSESAQTLDDYSDEASTSDGGVEVAGAVAVGDITSTTQASLSSTVASQAGGSATLTSTARESSTVSGDGSATSGSVGVGVGVAINIGHSANNAFIDQNLTAAGVELQAGDGAMSQFDTSATAGAGASSVGVAGALAINVIDDEDRAEIRSGTISATGGDLTLIADSNTSGSATAKPVEDGGATGDGVGFGASVAMNIAAHTARAIVSDGVIISDIDNLTMHGTGRHDVTTEAEAGAEGGVAITPVLALSLVDNETLVRLGSGDPLVAGGGVDIRADHRGTLATTAKGSTKGDKAAIGGAFAITTITDSAVADVLRSIDAADAVTLSALSGSVSESVSTASAAGGDDDDSDNGDDDSGGVDQEITRQQSQADMVQTNNGVGNDGQMNDEEAPSAESSEGKVNLAAAVSVNVASSTATASIADAINITAGDRLTVESSNNTDGKATTDASAVGDSAQVGIGAAVAINRVVSSNSATVGNGVLNVEGFAVRASMTELDGSDTTNTATVTAMSGAGGSSVGVAGSLALNTIDMTTVAEVGSGAQLNVGGDSIMVTAEHESDLTAKAMPAEDGGAMGGKVGVGASVALNLGGGQSTTARIADNVTMNDLSSLTVTASGKYDVTTEAKAGAEGGVAVDAVVALAVLDETTEASVGEGNALAGLSGDSVVSADSSGARTTKADADLQSATVGVGAAAAVVTSESRTRATLSRDIATNGNLSIAAMSDRSYDTEATAGARGADMSSVEEPSEKRDKTTSTKTLDDTSDSQRGGKDGGKVSVAAAVAVSDIDDDVEAKVTGSRTLTVGGEFDVSAVNNSNFSSRGRGDAVDSTVAVGIGVGVGLSIAKNDTLASIDDGSSIVDAVAISVLAQSEQNTADDFVNKLAAEAIAGAGAKKVGVAGAFGVAFSETTTRASVGQIEVNNGGTMTVAADNTSKLSAKAWSGAKAKVGVGASVATVYSDNEYAATIAAGSDLNVDGLTVNATNHVVEGDVGFDFKDFSTLTENNLQLILGTNNYYTEALAGSGGTGVAVSGAFAVNIFKDVLRAEIEAPEQGGTATTINASGNVEVSSNNEVRAKAFAGALAATSKVGVGVSTADIFNTTRSISSISGNVTASDVSVSALSNQDFATFGVSGAGAGNTGVAGAVNIIVSENEVNATLAEDSDVVASNNVVVAASNDIDITTIAGGAAGGGTAGVGISSATNVIDNSTRAEIGRNAVVRANALGASTTVPQGNKNGDSIDFGGVAVSATASENLFTIAAGGGGGGSAGVAGSGAVNVLGVSTHALIADGVTINDNTMAGSTDQSVYVLAADHTDSFTVAGAVAGGGSAGVGAGADVSVMSKDTQAYIQAADVRARGNVQVAARSSEEISSFAATVGIGGSAGIAGSAGVGVVDIITRGFIGQDDGILASPTVVVAEGSVVVEAESQTEIDMLAGGVSGGGSAGVGASAVVAVINKQTDAFIGTNSSVDGLALRAPVDAATGRFDFTRVTPAEEDGKVSPAGGDNNADLTDDGSDDIDNEVLTTERVATAGRDSFSGVAVTATNQDDIATTAASGGGAGSVAVNISGGVVVLDADTTARVAEGATVNATQGADAQSVRVAASNDFQRLGIAAAASVGGAVGVTPGADITVASLNTLATVDNAATINAGGDVEVLAASSQDVLTVAAGAAGGGTVGVAGVVSVVSVDSSTKAQVGADASNAAEAATVDANGNVIVAADDRTESLLVAGSLGVGLGAAGIGGSVGVTSIDKDTRALIGNFATVNADGNSANLDGLALSNELNAGPLATRDGFTGLLVQATSAENIKSIAAAAAAGFYAGLAGGVSVQTIDSDTVAAVGSSVLIDAGAGAGSEEVLVAAANQFEGFGFGGGLGGGAVGVGGGVDIGTVRNDTSASVGADSNVTSSGDFTLLALADKDVHSIAASAAGGIGAVAGSVSVWSLGTAYDDSYSVDEEDQETGEMMTRTDAGVDDDGFDSTTSHVDMQTGQFSSLLEGFDDPDMNEDAMAGLQSATGDINTIQAGANASSALSEASVAAGTSALIDTGATVTSGNDLWVRADDDTTYRVDAGSVSVGGVGIGAAIAVANTQNLTTARAAEGATLAAGADADDNLWLLANYDEDITGLVAAGAAGGAALGAQVLVLTDNSMQRATLEDEVSVTRAGGVVNVSATGKRDANLDSAGASFGAIAAGVAVAVADFGGGSTAQVDNVTIGSGGTVGSVVVNASSQDDIAVNTKSVTAGTSQALTGAFAVADADATVVAAITDGATINTNNSIDVSARSQATTAADAIGVAVGGGFSGGASVALSNSAPNVTAMVGDNVTLDAGGDIAVRAIHNTDDDGIALANTGAAADAIAGAGGLVGGAAGAIANADSTATVRAMIADGDATAAGTELTAAGDVLVAARASHEADASTVGVGVGFVGVGISLANADATGTTESLLAAYRVTGANISVDANSFDTAMSETVAGAGGIVAGSGAIATSDVNSTTTARTGADVELVSGNAVDVTAAATTSANADSKGINAGGLAIGVSQATASTNPTVEAGLGNNAQLTAQNLTVSASRLLPVSGISALSNTSGSSGGLVGVNATESTAEDAANVSVTIGDGSMVTVTGTTTLEAQNASRQDANASSITAGIIAAGANLATAMSNNTTTVQLGGTSTLTSDQLVIQAIGDDTNYADSTAGSGGIVSGSAASAVTDTTANTLADTGTGDVIATNFALTADQFMTFDSHVNSVNASLVGASGANAENTAEANVTARVGADGSVMANDIAIVAGNTVRKNRWGSGNGWNISSGSGGAIDAPAAQTRTVIGTNALVDLGTGASILQLGDRDAPGQFTVDAFNDVVAFDRVQMNSGGAVSVAKGQSKTFADNINAAINVGDSATLRSVGDILMGTRSVGDIRNAVAVDTYGLAGAPRGETTSHFGTSNQVAIGQDAKLVALRDISIGAGSNSAGEVNSVNVRSRTDLWNNTIIPINGTPNADASIVTDNSVEIEAGAEVAAVRDAHLLAVRGNTRASGVGIAKDIYREILAAAASAISNFFGGGDVSFDIHGGSSSDSASGAVTVDGSVRVGTESRLELTFDVVDGVVVEERMVNGVVVGSDEGIQTIGSPQLLDIAQDILDRINDLYALILEYTVDDENSSATIAARAYESEIAFLERKLEDMGFPVIEDPVTGERRVGFTGAQNLSPQEVADARISRMTDDINEAEAEQAGLEQQNMDLEAENDALDSQNMALEDANTMLDAENMSLSDANAMLMMDNMALEANIVDLMMQQDALDPMSPTYDADFAALQAMIDADQSMIDANTGTIDANTMTIADNDMTISDNDMTIADNTVTINSNLVTVSMNETDIMNLDADIVQLNADIQEVNNGGPYSDMANGGPVAEFRTIDDVTAQLGNIFIEGTDLRGAGVLEAPGNALISIVNNTPTFLRLNDLIIPSNTGGKLFVNNVDVKTNAAINAINRSSSGAGFNITTGATEDAMPPVIEVISKYDPLDSFYVDNKTPLDLPPLAPDVIVTEGSVISNLLGSVSIDMAAGNIRIEQGTTIAGNEINIETRNGDFVQSYTEGFTHVNAAPLVSLPGADNAPSTVIQQAQAGSGIVANGSVLLAGRYLNINGTVQSGIPEWGVVIPDQSAVQAADGTVFASFADAQAYYAGLVDPAAGEELFQVIDASLTGLPGGTQGDRAQIAVNYNAQENRLELAGVQVQGGYIELFGQIFNTNQGVGQLRVLDGFGQVRINNTSGLDLMLNVLDTGRGVSGQIRITNILDDESIADTVVFARAEGDPRTGMFFDPQAGLRFDTIAGSNDVIQTRYLYAQSGWFGFDTGVNQLSDSDIVAGPDSVANPLVSGSFLRLNPGQTNTLVPINETLVTSDTFVPGASWRDCNWWTLCINSTHYREYFRTTGTTNLNGFSVTGDYGIGIEFIGFDEGLIDIASAGNVLINGSLNNSSGDISLISTGSIEQLSETAILTGMNIDLAGTSIGSDMQAVRIGGLDGGALNATAAAGSLYIDQLTGVMNLGQVSALNGIAALSADNDIVSSSVGSVVRANRVELTSRSGGIGTGSVLDPDGAIAIETGSTTSLDLDERAQFGLVASARDNVKVINTNGDLMVIDVQSLSGDVRLEATGSIVDNNPVSRSDERTIDELNELWDSMRLRGQLAVEKAEDEIVFFENGVTQDYRTYWNQRNQQADPSVYDANYTVMLSDAEETAIRDQLEAQGRTQEDIDTIISSYAEDRTNEYHRLHARLYDPSSDDAIQGAVATTFSADFRYEASDAEITERTTGSSWEQFQLELPVAAGLLKEITDTVTEVKDPNVRGGNVVLVAGENVGIDEMVREIDLSLGLDALDRSDRAAIAAAERGDVTVTGPNDNILEIIKRTPVNIEQTSAGTVRVDASNGYAYLGSEQDLNIDQVLASGDVRIKVAGSLLNGSGNDLPNVVGDTIILEAASGNIGTADAPMGIQMGASGAMVARALDDIHARTTSGDFRLDTFFSRGDVYLSSGGSILDAFETDDLNLLGSSIYLDADGSIGENLNPVDVRNDPMGVIEASSGPGEGIFLNVPEGTAIFGSLMSGGMLNLSSTVGYTIDGLIEAAGSMNLSAVRSIAMGDTGALIANGDLLSIIAGSFTMADMATVDAQGNLIIEVADREIDNGDGSTETVPGGAVLSTVVAGNDVDITAGMGGLDITQSLTAGGTINIATTASITGAMIDGGGSVLLTATDDVQLDELNVGDDLTVDAAGINIDTTNAGGSASFTAGAAGAMFNSLTVGNDLTVISAADLVINNASSGGASDIQTMGNLSVIESLAADGPLNMTSSESITGDFIESGADAMLSAVDQITLNTLVVANNANLTATGIELDTTTIGGSAALAAGDGGVSSNVMSVGNDLDLVSGAGINMQDTTVGGSASLTAGVSGVTLGLMSAGNELNVTSEGDVTLNNAASGGATDIQAEGSLAVLESLVADGALAMVSSASITGEYVESGGDATLSAQDQITLDTLVVANDVNMSATGIDLNETTVGGSADFAAGTDGFVSGMLTAGNNVSVVSASGVEFDLFNAGGLVDVMAVGNVGGTDAMSAQIIAGELSITSTEGAIANLEQPLSVEVAGDVSLNAFGDIGVHAVNSDLLASQVVSQSGSIDLLISDGAATLGTVSAPEDITIEAADGLAADEIDDALTVNLTVTCEGGEAAVDKLGVVNELVVMADVIDLPNVVHLGEFLPLKVDLTGNDGGLADSIEFVADTSVSVDFVNFKTSDFELTFTSDLVSFTDMEIGEFGRLVTPRHDIVIDNVNRVLYPSATAQLYAFNEPFDLTTTNDNLIFTTARLVDYNPFYTINQFSTENSLVRLSPKRLTLWGRLVRGLTAEPLTTISPEEEVISLDSGGVLMLEGMPPISMQLN